MSGGGTTLILSGEDAILVLSGGVTSLILGVDVTTLTLGADVTTLNFGQYRLSHPWDSICSGDSPLTEPSITRLLLIN